MNLPLVVIGFGGHGRVVASALLAAGNRVLAATDLCPERSSGNHLGISVMTDEEMKSRFRPSEVKLVLGIGSIKPTPEDCQRVRTVKAFKSLGFEFTGVRHPYTWIAETAEIAATAQIHAGAIVQPGAVIGDFSILNSRSSVDHDCRVGDFCHIGPGVTLSGDVHVGDGSHLGTGCCVIQGIKVAQNCFVAAGATVVGDIDKGVAVRGTPAKPFSWPEKS